MESGRSHCIATAGRARSSVVRPIGSQPIGRRFKSHWSASGPLNAVQFVTTYCSANSAQFKFARTILQGNPGFLCKRRPDNNTGSALDRPSRGFYLAIISCLQIHRGMCSYRVVFAGEYVRTTRLIAVVRSVVNFRSSASILVLKNDFVDWR